MANCPATHRRTGRREEVARPRIGGEPPLALARVPAVAPARRRGAATRQRLQGVLLDHQDGDALAVEAQRSCRTAPRPRAGEARPSARRAAAAPAAAISAIAMARIWRWPPLKRRARAARRFSRQHRKAREDLVDAGARWRGRHKPPISRFSATVIVAEDVALLRHEGEAERLISRRRTPAIRVRLSGSARFGWRRPAIGLSSVDLPAPFGPMRATISPARPQGRRPSGSRRRAIAAARPATRSRRHRARPEIGLAGPRHRHRSSAKCPRSARCPRP